MRFPSFALAGGLTLACIVGAAEAHAQSDPATAQTLFNDGKGLMKAGKYALACPKLEESQRLDPGIGTLFHLAECNAHLGKTASAWAEYLEVAGVAHSQQQKDREKVARERAAALEPKIPKVVIVAGGSSSVPGFEVRRDGAEVGRAQWGSPLPIDPGEHVFRAAATGKRAWEMRVTAEAGATRTVSIPTLDDVEAAPLGPAPVAVVPAAPPETVATDTTTDPNAGSNSGGGLAGQRVAALVAGGVGLVGVGIGTYFGIASKSDHDDAQSHCVGNTCDKTGVGLRDDAVTHGTISTIAFIAGGALVATGVVLWVATPSDDGHRQGGLAPAPAPPRARVGITPGGLVLGGTF